MIGMLKRHKIEILLKAAHSQPEVARLPPSGRNGGLAGRTS